MIITIIMALMTWTGMARGAWRFLALREEDFILAACLDGARPRRRSSNMCRLFSHIIAWVTISIPYMISAKPA
jgi:peptide/nickel transport system permease protein